MSVEQKLDLSIRPTERLESGLMVQLTEGEPEGGEVPGIVISAEAFDIVQAAIEPDRPGLNLDPNGVTKLPAVWLPAIGRQLRASAARGLDRPEEQALLLGIAEFVESVGNKGLPVTVLGY